EIKMRTVTELAAAAAFLAAMTLPVSATAQVYRCVHDGRTEYMQTKPKDGQCDPIKEHPLSPPTDGSAAASLQHFSKEIDKSRAAEAKEQEVAERNQQTRQHACSIAKHRQAMLDNFGSRF